MSLINKMAAPVGKVQGLSDSSEFNCFGAFPIDLSKFIKTLDFDLPEGAPFVWIKCFLKIASGFYRI